MPAAVKIWFVRVFPFPFRETFLNWLRAFSLQLQISYSCMVTPWVTGRVTIQVTTSRIRDLAEMAYHVHVHRVLSTSGYLNGYQPVTKGSNHTAV